MGTHIAPTSDKHVGLRWNMVAGFCILFAVLIAVIIVMVRRGSEPFRFLPPGTALAVIEITKAKPLQFPTQVRPEEARRHRDYEGRVTKVLGGEQSFLGQTVYHSRIGHRILVSDAVLNVGQRGVWAVVRRFPNVPLTAVFSDTMTSIAPPERRGVVEDIRIAEMIVELDRCRTLESQRSMLEQGVRTGSIGVACWSAHTLLCKPFVQPSQDERLLSIVESVPDAIRPAMAVLVTTHPRTYSAVRRQEEILQRAVRAPCDYEEATYLHEVLLGRFQIKNNRPDRDSDAQLKLLHDWLVNCRADAFVRSFCWELFEAGWPTGQLKQDLVCELLKWSNEVHEEPVRARCLAFVTYHRELLDKDDRQALATAVEEMPMNLRREVNRERAYRLQDVTIGVPISRTESWFFDNSRPWVEMNCFDCGRLMSWQFSRTHRRRTRLYGGFYLLNVERSVVPPEKSIRGGTRKEDAERAEESTDEE